MTANEGIKLSEGNIEGVQDSNKYFGIPQADVCYEEAARKSTETKHLQKVR